jgi:hypothetical protein
MIRDRRRESAEVLMERRAGADRRADDQRRSGTERRRPSRDDIRYIER